MPDEHPIIFRGEMVRAILAGRKTQTRRIVTVPWKGRTRTVPYEPYWADEDGVLMMDDDAFENGDGLGWIPHDQHCRSPYGVPGDHLWVKETWAKLSGNGIRTVYRADGEEPRIRPLNGSHMKWRPSIFMPRSASRITLEFTSKRIERLQAISEHDAEAEGVGSAPGLPDYMDENGVRHPFPPSYVRSFHRVWDEINGKTYPWDKNPWVWVISFRKLAA